MADDNRLLNLIERWDELGWFDRKLIDWVRFRSKHQIDMRLFHTVGAVVTICIIVIVEEHPNRATVLLAMVVLLYFYVMLLMNVMANWGNRNTGNSS